MKNILGKKIEITPKTPKENQIVCEVCGGTGWTQDDEETMIIKCSCNDGLIDVCQYCGRPFKYSYSKRCECKEYKLNEQIERDKKNKEYEMNLFKKAKVKTTILEADKSKIEMMYSEVYPYNEGYFTEIEELEEYCEDNDIEMPKYVYGTYKSSLSINAYDMVESECENNELHEDAFNNITNLEELQTFLDDWCSKQTGTDTYSMDTNYIILL